MHYVDDINKALKAAFPGSLFYGVATYLPRDGKLYPVVDERDVSFDDTYPVSGYHKITRIVPKSTGFNTLLTYNCQLIVHNATRLPQHDLAEQLLSVLDPLVTVTDIVLVSEQIFSTEYRGHPYSGASLIQITYTVDAAKRTDCCVPVRNNCLTKKII